MQSRAQPKQDLKRLQPRGAAQPSRCWLALARRIYSRSRPAGVWRYLLGLCILCIAAGGSLASAASQETVPPGATPTITSVQPSKAEAGTRVTLEIEGEKFAPGAYVSFSDPGIHVLATRRLSGKRLEVDVAIGDKAPPESLRLYVANPSGAAGGAAFEIVSRAPSAAKSPAPPSGSPTVAQPSTPTSGPGSGVPAAGQPPAAAVGSPNAPKTIEEGASAPEISKLNPEQVAAGSKASITVKGKRFVKGAKVAFQNRGIRVLGTDFKKSTELVVQIEVASDAATGKTNLFVVNPDESEVQASIEVTAATSSSTAASGPSKSFSVINLGDAINLLHNPNQPRGKLILAGGTLTYQESGKGVFVAKPGEVKEVAPNIIFGINTGTFHIILTSGKSYNFVAASLMPSDTASIISALQQAVQ